MDTSILLGYAAGIITMAGIAMYPENLRPTVTESPRSYLMVGITLGIMAVGMDLFWSVF